MLHRQKARAAFRDGLFGAFRSLAVHQPFLKVSICESQSLFLKQQDL